MNQTVESIKTYFKGVKTEWGKVSWPEKKQVVFETMSVVVIVFVFTVAIYLMDLLFKSILGLIK
ncbi:preprotein translocase subunit SecE [bacterium]|nr:preprotein translocase subunit SecE [bacterium]